jgi:hypothetical protein
LVEAKSGDTMKLIVAISAIAVAGLTYFYQAQETDSAGKQNSVEVKTQEVAPVVGPQTAIDVAIQSDSMDSEGLESNQNNSKYVESTMGSELTQLVKTADKISSTKITKPIAKKSIAKNIPKKQIDQIKLSQAAVNKTTISLKKNDSKKTDKDFSSVLDVSFNTDARETTDGDKGYDTQLWYFLTYKINDTYKARLWIDITKDFTDSYEEKIKDTKITLSRKGWALTEKLKLSPSVTSVIPTSEKSKRNEELQLGIQVNPSLSYKLTESVSLSYLPRMIKNFHAYETSRTNKTNTEYKLVQFYSVGYSFAEKWSVSTLLIHSNTWSYKGTRRDPSYMTNLELSYDVNESLSLATGTIQGGSILDRENGPDKNISLYDENETTLYGNFALKF